MKAFGINCHQNIDSVHQTQAQPFFFLSFPFLFAPIVKKSTTFFRAFCCAAKTSNVKPQLNAQMPSTTIDARFVLSDEIPDDWRPTSVQRRHLLSRLHLDIHGHVTYAAPETKRTKACKKKKTDAGVQAGRFRWRIKKQRVNLRRLLYSWAIGDLDPVLNTRSYLAPACNNPACLAPGHQHYQKAPETEKEALAATATATEAT